MSKPGFPFARLRVLANDRRASAAVEFAIILPVSIALFAGSVDVYNAVIASRKLTNITRTIADLTSKQATSAQPTSTPTPLNAVSSDTLAAILTSGQTLLYPASTSGLKMTLSAIDVTNKADGNCCSVLVRWSYTLGGELRPCGTQLTPATGSSLTVTQLPAALFPKDSTLSQPISYLIADTSYRYVPMIREVAGFSTAVAMSRNEFSFPRSSGQVVTSALPASGTSHGTLCY